ncbi:MAG: DUF6525 family protein [Pseudomonadota bacterium]
MRDNSGQTSLKRRRARTDPMQEFDRLPSELRLWLASAVLPWGPKSALRAYRKFLARTGDPAQALAELERRQTRLLAKDAVSIWGPNYPTAPQQSAL